MKVKSTTNYDKFKKIRGNRDLNKVYLNKLIKSIEDNNMLEVNPIIVNKDMQIIDGQHRLASAEKLEIPIYYVVVNTGSIDEIQQLNANQRNWTMKDFHKSFIARGKKQYLILQDFIEKHNISLSLGRRLLEKNITHGGSNAKRTRAFKRGDFKANNIKFAEKFLERMREVSKIAGRDITTDRPAMRALYIAYQNGMEHEEFIKQLDKKGKFHEHSRVRDAIREVEDVLSYYKHRVVRIPYATTN